MKMRKTLITALVLGTCVVTQAFAQNNKEDTITFALTTLGQASVSSSTAVNAGNWSSPPTHYKTVTNKLTQADIIQGIGAVMHNNAKFYSTKASLVLVQGELSGFLGMDPNLGHVYATHDNDEILDGWYDSDNYYYWDDRTDLPNSTDSLFATLPNGRHFQSVPEYQWDLQDDSYDIDTPADFIGKFPTGHQQPWGQIFVKDPSSRTYDDVTYGAAAPFCENVTFFFAITVQECYDCYYLNSFVSDAIFNFKGTLSPVPCCGGTSVMLGKGVDRYYMTMSFDNTVNNPYLNYDLWDYVDYYEDLESWYVGIDGIAPGSHLNLFYWTIWYEGVYPDAFPYFDPIKSGALTVYEAYLLRFTLNGIMTYSWTLGFINTSDLWPDFVGTGTYVVNGYGYIRLVCELITGTVQFTEKSVKTPCCIYAYDSDAWWEDWYGPGYYPIQHVDNEDSEYYPDSEWSNLWMDGVGYENFYYNVSGDGYVAGHGITPFNTEASLSYHANFDESYEPWTTKDFIDWVRYYLHDSHWH
jgi:hypothetical protein